MVRRLRGDPQPVAPAVVLLASPGAPFSDAAVARAAELAGSGGVVAVLSIVRIHGTSLGLPNPGLLPTKAEKKAQVDLVDSAIRRLERRGVEADGQVAATRKAVRAIARVARARSARSVVMDAPASPRWRLFLEGDPTAGVRRRLGDAAVEVVGGGRPAP